MSKPKFKVGPAKLRDGREVIIHTLDGPDSKFPMVISVKDPNGAWDATRRDREGRYSYLSESYDILPNVEPEKHTFVCRWLYQDPTKLWPHGHFFPSNCPTTLEGKRTRVTVEVLEDEE